MRAHSAHDPLDFGDLNHIDVDQLGLRDLIALEDLRQLLDALTQALSCRVTLQDRDAKVLLSSGAGGVRGKGAIHEIDLPVPDLEHRSTFGRLILNSPGRAPADTLRVFRQIAGSVGRIASQEREARRRIGELTAVYNTSMMLAEARGLADLLDRFARLIVEVMGVKGASIRLIDESSDELRIAAAFGLSQAYTSMPALRLSKAAMDHVALEHGHEQSVDLSRDVRVQFPEMPEREGITSMLSVGMRYRGKSVGVLRAYSAQTRRFGVTEVELMKAVAAQAAAAIVNTRLDQERQEAAALEQQVSVAADVQHRMIPHVHPRVSSLQVATSYVPCHELAGDLFDFLPLSGDRLGVVVADVAGKGVPASLTMATVRAYLRASVEHLDDPAEIVRRLNELVCHDNRPGEFVSLLYGVIDPKAREFRFVLAGHVPPMLCRQANVEQLPQDVLHGNGDIVLGVVEQATFRVHVAPLQPGDTLVIYTDGLSEARDFNGGLFGDARVADSIIRSARAEVGVEELVQNLLWDMRRFVGLQRRTDDVTLVAIRLVDGGAEMRNEEG